MVIASVLCVAIVSPNDRSRTNTAIGRDKIKGRFLVDKKAHYYRYLYSFLFNSSLQPAKKKKFYFSYYG